ncbi:NAD-dependent epimerase/dehydratase family protein [Streptomyces sp. NPDC048018]|uniref:NAD-dependent epimerase/dehydratase family protein n=1 Tax=Streptomyces sp. NPDC048018 TaxID=3365499 RepID=UPI00372408CD
MQNILITGAGGFIGAHVTREAALAGARLTLTSHRTPPRPPAAGRARIVRADLAHPESLHGLCDGVDVLLHCASRIGGTPEANEAVNARGTAALVADAQRAGVSRIVHLSTASVYGRGIFRCARPEQLPRRPQSPTSRTRAEAEDAVLAAGGVVLRPHLVYGPGDAWVVPGLGRLLRTLPGTPTGWDARLSVISAAELAALIVAVGLAPRERLTSDVYHAAYPEPVTASALLQAVAGRMTPPPPRRNIGLAHARALPTEDGAATRALDMLATDHWFDSTPLWADLGRTPGAGWEADLARMAEWYPDAAAAA